MSPAAAGVLEPFLRPVPSEAPVSVGFCCREDGVGAVTALLLAVTSHLHSCQNGLPDLVFLGGIK